MKAWADVQYAKDLEAQLLWLKSGCVCGATQASFSFYQGPLGGPV